MLLLLYNLFQMCVTNKTSFFFNLVFFLLQIIIYINEIEIDIILQVLYRHAINFPF
jgi:hypothetical protein